LNYGETTPWTIVVGDLLRGLDFGGQGYVIFFMILILVVKRPWCCWWSFKKWSKI
jgi:hypothetical protein